MYPNVVGYDSQLPPWSAMADPISRMTSILSFPPGKWDQTQTWAVAGLFWLGTWGGRLPTGLGFYRGCYDVIVDPNSHTYTHTSRYTRPQLCTHSMSQEDYVKIMGGNGNETCVKIWPASEDCLLLYTINWFCSIHYLQNTISSFCTFLHLYISTSSFPCYSCHFLCFLWIEEAEECCTGRTLILLRHCFLFPHQFPWLLGHFLSLWLIFNFQKGHFDNDSDYLQNA